MCGPKEGARAVACACLVEYVRESVCFLCAVFSRGRVPVIAGRPPPRTAKSAKHLNRNFRPYVKTGPGSLVARTASVKDDSGGSNPPGLIAQKLYFSKFFTMTSSVSGFVGVFSFSRLVLIVPFRRSGLFVRTLSWARAWASMSLDIALSETCFLPNGFEQHLH